MQTKLNTQKAIFNALGEFFGKYSNSFGTTLVRPVANLTRKDGDDFLR